ncbi:MAG: hypothetical protein LBH00_06665 [Planctomycetaceae bacterium]|jgi:wyosine [tRNA(Phe)-imidazoG37] synthetase (radical SAM superfamily)|nr:hypothetical protein [Planctomycetaceae bacterium]
MSIVQHHPRRFSDLIHVYPVISRRSGGLSIGVNLSPTAACNFACVYCQVLAENSAENRRIAVGSPRIALDQLNDELRFLVGSANNGSLFLQSWLASVPPEKRVLRDIAFSGDGEPTLSPQFADAVNIVADVRRELCGQAVKLVLITNASALHIPRISAVLEKFPQDNGEIWAKLDAGTPALFNKVSRSSVSFETIRNNLVCLTRTVPAVIQTCFVALHGQAPDTDEICRYADILNELTHVVHVQIYTAARNMPEKWVSPLNDEQLDAIAESVRQQTGREIRTYYSR